MTDPSLPPSPASVVGASKGRWLVAGAVGVVVSVLSSIAFAFLLTGPENRSSQTVIGIAVGSVVVGLLVKANNVRSWVAAVLMVFVAQLALGFVLISLVVR